MLWTKLLSCMAMFWFSEVSNVLAWVISATWECLYEIIDGSFSKKIELYYCISLVLVHIVVTLYTLNLYMLLSLVLYYPWSVVVIILRRSC